MKENETRLNETYMTKKRGEETEWNDDKKKWKLRRKHKYNNEENITKIKTKWRGNESKT